MRPFKFIFQFLFVDQKEGHISHTKFWSQIGYAIMCWAFVWAIYTGETKVGYELWMVFGSVVIGNRAISKALNNYTTKKD